MTATTISPPATAPQAPPRRRGRIATQARRELTHLAVLAVGVPVAWGLTGALRQVAPFHVWWPLLLGGAVYVSCLCRAPEGSTGVMTGAKYAAGHPLQAAVVVAVVCLPWLGEWTLAAVRAGAEAGVRAALGGVPLPSVPTVPSVSDLSAHLPSWLGGH